MVLGAQALAAAGFVQRLHPLSAGGMGGQAMQVGLAIRKEGHAQHPVRAAFGDGQMVRIAGAAQAGRILRPPLPQQAEIRQEPLRLVEIGEPSLIQATSRTLMMGSCIPFLAFLRRARPRGAQGAGMNCGAWRSTVPVVSSRCAASHAPGASCPSRMSPFRRDSTSWLTGTASGSAGFCMVRGGTAPPFPVVAEP